MTHTMRRPARAISAHARVAELKYGQPLWDVLVERRARHGDQKGVAKQLNITTQTLRNWLKGYFDATAVDLDLAAKAWQEERRNGGS